MITDAEVRPDRPRRPDLRDARAAPATRRRGTTTPHLLHRGAAATTCSTRADRPRRRRTQERVQPPVPRRSAASTPRSTRRSRRRPSTPATDAARQRRRASTRAIVVARHQDRGDPGDGRRQGLRAGRERGQHGAAPAPDRIEHQAVHPRRRAAGRAPRPTTSSTAPAPCALPNPGDPKNPFVITGAVSGGRRHAAQTMTVALDQLRLRPAVADRRAQPRGRHRRTAMAQSPYLYPGSPTRSARRSSRTPASPPAPTR